MPVHRTFMKAKSLCNHGNIPDLRSQKDSFNTITYSLIAVCSMEEFKFSLLSDGEFNFHVKDIEVVHEKSSIFNDDGYMYYSISN
ncbi:hypothetical protein D6T17_24725 [Salmonella enterica subsp. enterica serovar Oranienburg]|nr:hypothetical protein [Salmonella enterica subsp. enterica serovar Oranienburg]EBY8947464.1 hypothetical protein [Salmonella enterica subsp. enterica serovar Oranienburg]